MTFERGDDVIVDFDGVEHQGEVERVDHGWIFCRIIIDLTEDYGSQTPRLSPHSTVCVREAHVRHADHNGISRV